MTFLLDTHIFLWSLGEPEKLTAGRTRQIQDRSNTVYVSAVSVAEIAIKCSLNKLAVDADILSASEASGFEWLDFKASEAILLKDLPYHHRDPFDRMLVAQSLANDLPVMTEDARFASYGCRLM
jgi:PIN domain nuclease of toxin-antitoxin system